MDLRFTWVPLKVGIGLVKFDFLAFPCVPLFIPLEFWWVLFAETVSAAKNLITETVSAAKILYAETLFLGHFGAFFGDQMLIQRGNQLIGFG